MSDYMPTPDQLAELTVALDAAARAGYGFRVGASFYAIPGCEDAAADFIEAFLFPADEGVAS